MISWEVGFKNMSQLSIIQVITYTVTQEIIKAYIEINFKLFYYRKSFWSILQ